VASAGARGIVGRSLGVGPQDPGYEALRDEFLARYAARLTRETRVFDAVAPVLEALAAAGLPWGIVTNKQARFTEPLVRALGLHGVAAAVVSGDTTPHAKPHPAPLVEGARRIGVAVAECAYVGDDLRDIQAGRAAGMATVAAAWGYLGQGEPVAAWGADHVIDEPGELLELLAIF
jgi:phosphoglycolate phosphatase